MTRQSIGSGSLDNLVYIISNVRLERFYTRDGIIDMKEGMAVYHESERSFASFGSAESNEHGLAIYSESERFGAEPQPVRLYDGKPFNAYQRSEWLGAER